MDKTEREVSGHDDIVEGTASAGRGDLANVEMLAELLRGFHARYRNPHISAADRGGKRSGRMRRPAHAGPFPVRGVYYFKTFF